MKYDAFISYSHSDCGNIAPAIQKAIENIGKPWYKIKRNLNVFRDETNLSASPNLWDIIEKALSNSNNFVLLASPQASKSYWINKEIENWLAQHYSPQGGIANFYIIRINGELTWDNESADFNWEKTINLPPILKGKFIAEPHWIDLTNYLNENNLPIDYKSIGFTSNLVKVVSGILNKPPREVESDELNRKRKTVYALFASSLFFITFLLSGIFFYTQNQTNIKNSIANNLIAEGNNFRETNITQALLLYAYAYQKNNDPNILKLLKSFYDENTLYRSEEYSVFEKNENEVDTLNVFYEKIKTSETPIDSAVSSEGFQFKDVFLNFPTDSYIIIDKNSILIYSLNSSKYKEVNFPFGNIEHVVNHPNSKDIFILTKNKNDLIYSYDLLNDKFELILTRSMISEAGFNNRKEFLEESDLNFKMVNSNMNNNLILYFEMFSADVNQEWLLYNVNHKKMTLFNPIKNKDLVDYFPSSYESINYFEQDSTVFFKILEGSSNQPRKSIYESMVTNDYKVIYYGGLNSKDIIQQPTVTTYSNGLVYGDHGGNITKVFEYDNLLQRPDKLPSQITSIATSERYIFTGSENGLFHIYLNKTESCSACIGGHHFSIRSVKLPRDSYITKVYYFDSILYLINREGEIYKINLNQYYYFENNSSNFVYDLVKTLGIEDLTIENKKNLGIID